MAGRPLQSLWLRRTLVTTLRADAELVALGTPPLGDDPDTKRIYGRRSPDVLIWPFIRVNVTDEGPLRKGTQPRVTIHTFSKAQFDDEVETLNARLQAMLEDAVLELSGTTKAFMSWVSTQTVPDAAEADAWHGLNFFTAMIG